MISYIVVFISYICSSSSSFTVNDISIRCEATTLNKPCNQSTLKPSATFWDLLGINPLSEGGIKDMDTLISRATTRVTKTQ